MKMRNLFKRRCSTKLRLCHLLSIRVQDVNIYTYILIKKMLYMKHYVSAGLSKKLRKFSPAFLAAK